MPVLLQIGHGGGRRRVEDEIVKVLLVVFRAYEVEGCKGAGS